MLPSSLAGLLLFVVLLAPGLAYVLRHEKLVPARPDTAFRETLRVIFVSVACLLVTGVLAAGVRWWFPHNTPDVRRLVQDPLGYWRGHHVQLAWWSLAFFLFATLLGVAAADPRTIAARRWVAKKTRAHKWLTAIPETHIRPESAWYRVMHQYDDVGEGPVMVGASMDDGTYVEGRVNFFNIDPEENEDREILLSAPLHVTTNGVRTSLGGEFTVISARHIVRLDVKHYHPDWDQRILAQPLIPPPGGPDLASPQAGPNAP